LEISTLAGIPAPPVKVGYDVALRRILRVSIAELRAAGDQWSDSARQSHTGRREVQVTDESAPLSTNRGLPRDTIRQCLTTIGTSFRKNV